MASDAQIRANRRNGQRSKGPKSAAGKERSAQNAVKHGLRSKLLWALATEEPHLRQLTEELWASHAPVGAQEEELLKLMIYDLLAIDRLQRIETSVLGQPEVKAKPPPTLTREQEMQRNEYLRYSDRLKKVIDTLDSNLLARVDQVEREMGWRVAKLLLDEIERAGAEASGEVGSLMQRLDQVVAECIAENANESAADSDDGPDEDAPDLLGRFQIVTPENGCGDIFESLQRGFTANTQLFNLLLRYRTNYENGYLKKLHELHRLQAMREGQAVALPNAVDLNVVFNSASENRRL